MLIRREALVSMWIPKGEVLVRGQCLFKLRRVLEKIRYTGVKGDFEGTPFHRHRCLGFSDAQ